MNVMTDVQRAALHVARTRLAAPVDAWELTFAAVDPDAVSVAEVKRELDRIAERLPTLADEVTP